MAGPQFVARRRSHTGGGCKWGGKTKRSSRVLGAKWTSPSSSTENESSLNRVNKQNLINLGNLWTRFFFSLQLGKQSGSWGTVGRLSLQHTKQILIHQLKACFELLTGLMAKQITQKEHIFSYFLLPRNLFVTMLCTKTVLLLPTSNFLA